jgi:predicted RNA-binding protein with PIN domain
VLVVVDAENVRRSLWPNLLPEQLVELLGAWAAEQDAEVLAVFDGRAPSGVARVESVGTVAESADDSIASRVHELDQPYVLVTSDRELRARAGEGAERIVGGGKFVRELTRADADAEEPRQGRDGA